MSRSRLRRLLGEPLLHFFVLGAGVFGLYALVGTPGDSERGTITVTSGQIEHLATTFARTWQRPPAAGELDALIDDHVREEIYAREAAALGLDRDDTVVRRRLRQKMEFLTEEALEPAPPTDGQLEEFLARHPERFRREPQVSFRQVFVSRDRRGDATDADARALLARLAAAPDADAEGLGDPTLLPREVALSSRSEIARLFGEPFAARLTDVATGRWLGPVESAYGLHLVYVGQREEGRVPALAEVRDQLAREWASAQRRDAVEAAYGALRSRYTVTVERPPDAGPGGPAR